VMKRRMLSAQSSLSPGYPDEVARSLSQSVSSFSRFSGSSCVRLRVRS